jgi:hypothetical protein
VEIRHLGGALAQPSAEQGVVGSTAEPYILFSVGVPMAPGLEAAIRHRFGRLGDAMGAHSSGRTLFNWLGEDLHPGRAFGREDLRRLQDIKRERDPQGTLHSNRPVLGTVLTVPTQR